MEEVCIVGGGVAGILAAKNSVSRGLKPVVFERLPILGGIWTGNDSSVGRWRSLVTNLSKYMMTYSDHLWPEDVPVYPTAEQYLDYIKSYVSKHELLQYFAFNTEVVKLDKEEPEGYRVWYKDSEGEHEKVFKYAIVAIGQFSKPKDLIKHKERFNGTLIHSGWYRDPEIFEGKNVVVIGSGYSGCDLAYEASKVAKSVTQVHRKKFCINTRLIGGVPGEFLTFNFPCLTQTAPLFFSLNSHANSIRGLISALGNPGEVNEALRINDEEIDKEYIGYPITYPEYYESIKLGKINCIRGEAIEYCENGVVLLSGQTVEADLIIDASGYTTSFNFLGPKIKEIAEYDARYPRLSLALFRNTIHPGLPGLAFSGNIQSFFSGLFELGADLCLRWITGTLQIPEEELWEGVRMEKEFRPESLRALWVYDLVGFQQDILRILKIEFDNELINELEFNKGFISPVFFYKDREGSKEIARDYVRSIKAAYPDFQFN